jgi:hypothetical protein
MLFAITVVIVASMVAGTVWDYHFIRVRPDDKLTPWRSPRLIATLTAGFSGLWLVWRDFGLGPHGQEVWEGSHLGPIPLRGWVEAPLASDTVALVTFVIGLSVIVVCSLRLLIPRLNTHFTAAAERRLKAYHTGGTDTDKS